MTIAAIEPNATTISLGTAAPGPAAVSVPTTTVVAAGKSSQGTPGDPPASASSNPSGQAKAGQTRDESLQVSMQGYEKQLAELDLKISNVEGSAKLSEQQKQIQLTQLHSQGVGIVVAIARAHLADLG